MEDSLQRGPCRRKGEEGDSFNNSSKEISFNGLIDGVSAQIALKPFELKTYLITVGKLVECELAIDYKR